MYQAHFWQIKYLPTFFTLYECQPSPQQEMCCATYKTFRDYTCNYFYDNVVYQCSVNQKQFLYLLCALALTRTVFLMKAAILQPKRQTVQLYLY